MRYCYQNDLVLHDYSHTKIIIIRRKQKWKPGTTYDVDAAQACVQAKQILEAPFQA